MNKLIIIDGNAIMHRAFHALPPLTAKNGEIINAVYGLTSMLLGMIQTFKPTHITVCFDRKEKTFRQEAFEKYQSQRPVMDDTLSPQFAKAQEVLLAMQIPVYSKAGFEADDLIGTIATQAVGISGFQLQNSNKKTKLPTTPHQSPIDEVIIVTGDKDILQLVDDKIKVFLPTKGVSEGKIHGIEDVLLKLDCLPEQVVDYKALVGDSSDNYPGVPGIGPKTASLLLRKYGSFKQIYEHLEEISESTRKKLIAGKESGELSFMLATIIRDVPVEFNFTEMAKWQIDSPGLLKLFENFGFKTLSKRVVDAGEALAKEKQGSLF